MIPLIDVSLVLLVFFIMTAGAVVTASGYKLPEAQYNLTSGNETMIWIGIHAAEADPSAPPAYSIGEGEKPPASAEDEGLTEKRVLQRLDALLAERGKPVEVQLRADEELPSGFVRRLQLALEQRPVVIRKYQRVNEKKP